MASTDAALSELPTAALRSLPPETQKELSKLFEFTTVTRKLRRIGRLSLPRLREAVRINRPAWLAITFADYIIPKYDLYKHTDLVHWYEDALGVPVELVSFGPQEINLYGNGGTKS
jgi:adenylosuccinate synthase